MVMIVVGNKIDKEGAREVSTEKAKEYGRDSLKQRLAINLSTLRCRLSAIKTLARHSRICPGWSLRSSRKCHHRVRHPSRLKSANYNHSQKVEIQSKLERQDVHADLYNHNEWQPLLFAQHLEDSGISQPESGEHSDCGSAIIRCNCFGQRYNTGYNREGYDTGNYVDPFLFRNLKFVIVGNSGVGKTRLLIRYVESTFTTAFYNTIGVDFVAVCLCRK